MADLKDTIKEAEAPEKINYQKDLKGKSIRQVAEEIVKPKVNDDIKKDFETPPAKGPLDEAKEQFEKQAHDLAEQARKDKEELRAEIKKIEESKKTEEAKKEEIKEVKARWKGKDPTTGEPVPTNYDEIVEVAKEELRREFEDQRLKEQEEAKQKSEQETKTQEEQKQQADQRRQQIDRQITDEYNVLVESGQMPKPKGDLNDEEDFAVQERRRLFSRAIEVNNERISKGETVLPLTAVYLGFFKKSAQPAGEDAPVGGTKVTTPPPNNSDRYVYARDHNRSFRDIGHEIVQKIKG